MPSREQILDFVRSRPTAVGKSEIARAFRLGPADRVKLKAMLKELVRDGAEILGVRGGERRPSPERGTERELGREPGRAHKGGHPGAALPPYLVIEATGRDVDGELEARPQDWPHETPPPRIVVVPAKAPSRGREPALAIGGRALARMTRTDDGTWEAVVVRSLDAPSERVLGVFEPTEDGGGFVQPTDRRQRHGFRVERNHTDGAGAGELVLIERQGHQRRFGAQLGRVVARIGRTDAPGAISLIAVHTRGIPVDFPPEALADAAAAVPVTALGDRTDLRHLPLVTIDGADARDFDDAVWAEPDDDAANPGGWRLIVAIADVAAYVRPGAPLDRAARERGNSVYFPDRVVPMLPERLSNDLCSLRPHEDRPCMAVEMTIDAEGEKRGHRFMRALMRSTARLTYEQVQAARDGHADATTRPLLDRPPLQPTLGALYGAFAALDRARRARGTLELDLPERQVKLGADGKVEEIVPRPRLDSHRLIEEFMILANVAAAETLEQKRQPCMYRVHDKPAPDKVDGLREVAATLGLKLARGQVLKPRHFAQLLEGARDTPHVRMLSDLVLRAQAQAVYSPENLGHFGLALRRYAHFTSPIRRYADLLVHRALVSGLKLGPDGLESGAVNGFEAVAEHISTAERRAAAAERDAIDRYVAAFLSDRVGATFAARVNGVTRFGLFVTLAETGADGLVPIRSLPEDYYHHDETHHALTGRRFGRVFRLGDAVEVVLKEANPVTGGLVFHLQDGGRRAPGRPGKRPNRSGRD